MPFSREKTDLIKAQLRDRLENGNPNNWERSFFSDMLERFNSHGTKTRLTSAQYRKLHQLLDIPREAKPERTSERKAPRTSAPARPKRPHRRPASPLRAIRAPQRAMRRATRQVMWPLVLVLGFLGLVGSAFDTSSSGAVDVRQTERNNAADYLIVTGSSVNQRSGPGTGDAVMGQLSEGTRVRRLNERNGWTQVSSESGTGWMSSRYLQSLSSRTAAVENVTTNQYSLSASAIRVIDGDTIGIRGQSANVRLVGFNAPETSSPQCQAELNAGRRATARLNALVSNAQSIELERVRCACQPGTDGTSRCNFGRQCGVLRVNGADVGRILISEGLAVP
ncbi:SH3 domain-containing protein [Roseobacter weihaiensis]|uniref:SH3 domain-containing protein n=1 Tax=Roseobacter weihaiensis TaxID=2763262 RepID=UPI001D0AFA67|nr:SH3 domain-containing protein [Roseobacter sp. H9]